MRHCALKVRLYYLLCTVKPTYFTFLCLMSLTTRVGNIKSKNHKLPISNVLYHPWNCQKMALFVNEMYFFPKTISYMVVMDHLKNITISFFQKQSLCHLILAMQLNTEKHVLVLELTVISNAFLYNLIAISEFKIWMNWSNGQLLALNLELPNCQN